MLPATESGKLDALALNDTNRLEIRVFGNAAHRHAVLVARLDNLGDKHYQTTRGYATGGRTVYLGLKWAPQ